MAGGQVVTPFENESDVVDISNHILLKQFPPKLRKLAKYLLESEEPMTVSDACRDLNLNRASIGTLIYKAKQKGNDFIEFINEQSKMLLHSNRIGVYKAVVLGSVAQTSTAHQHQKLFSQLVGDTREDVRINSSITLAIGMNVTMVQPADQDREKGVIDTEPVIPSGR